MGSYEPIDIREYREISWRQREFTCVCSKCRFGVPILDAASIPVISSTPPTPIIEEDGDINSLTSQKSASIGGCCKSQEITMAISLEANTSAPETEVTITKTFKGIQTMKLPAEILLLVCDKLEYADVMAFVEAWDTIGEVVARYDIIRTRELQCFCFKTNYMTSSLGVGVNIERQGKTGSFESEFNLLSMEGFKEHGIRCSVQGVEFNHWLGLPISHGHWARVKDDVTTTL